jgi:protease-4
MRGFFKMFFASFLALFVFILIVFFFILAIVGAAVSKDKPEVASNSVLMLDLSKPYPEKTQSDPFAELSGEGNPVSLFNVLRLIQHAKTDDKIKGIYIDANSNANGFAASNEIRNALLDFRKTKKFVIAYGDVMSQTAYFVASAADKVYVNPVGDFDWKGLTVVLPFVKGTLDKLGIQTQIFYAGKFKSATEIFRVDKMTPENRTQTMEWLGDIYSYMLAKTAESRNLDSTTLRQLANAATIETPQDAVNARLIDGAKYDDQIKDEIKNRLGLGKTDKMNMLQLSQYNESVNLRNSKSDRIAVILAEGDIVDGEGEAGSIGGDNYRRMIRKARLDKSVKAIVLRVNSGGGSALASENIWRELQMAKQDGKPVVVSFGDVAASGGYYIAAGADSIFANPNTITGSIGVFGVIPNMQPFFKDKMGVTFDQVNTAAYADAGGIHRPLNEREKQLIQNSVDRIYTQFKQRVSAGRKKDIAYIDSIAQGRVWSGTDAIRIGLVDRIGNLQDAVNAAAKLAKLKEYSLRQFPETKSWFDNLLDKKKSEPAAYLRAELGEDNYRVYRQMIRVKQMTESIQTRLPFDFSIR